MDIDFSFIYWGKEMGGGGGVNTKTIFVWGKKEKEDTHQWELRR